MLVRTIARSLLRNTQRCYFAEQPFHATAPAYLTPQQIKSTVPPEDYSIILQLVKTKEDLELNSHNQRLRRVESQLGETDKARLKKIESLVASLNEQQAQYVRYRLLTAVENPYTQ